MRVERIHTEAGQRDKEISVSDATEPYWTT